MINLNSKIFVAGHKGLVGSAIVRKLNEKGYKNIITIDKRKLDLTNQSKVLQFLKKNKPKFIFIAAAKVGGIYSNNKYKAEFIQKNLSIQTNLIHSAYLIGIKNLIFLGSSCVYPKKSKQPIKEEYLLTGPLEVTNDAYAIAKIAGIKMCQSYNKQYGTNYLSVMPTNLYGINDNFHPEDSHVVPSLIRKFHKAKMLNADSVNIWGDGTPRREFLHTDDLAAAVLFLMENYNDSEIVNVGCGQDQTIMELAETIQEVVGFKGYLNFDSSYPNGTPQKILDISKIKLLGWKPNIPLKEGLKQVYQWYGEHNKSAP